MSFGIKKRSWFGGCSRVLSVRPAFMEPMIGDGNRGNIVNQAAVVDMMDRTLTADYHYKKDGGALRMRRSSLSSPRSSFPLKDDAGYIGYMTDDDESGSSGSGHEEEGGDVMNIVRRRRREMLRTDADVSFSGCLFMMITACGLLMLFLWGFRPPTAGTTFGSRR
jgi:hypothetical protein